MTTIPIRQNGAWEAAHINFLDGTLRAPLRGLPIRPQKAIILLPPPPKEQLLRVFVIHSFGERPEFMLDDSVRVPFARIERGNRYLEFFHAAVPIDVERERRHLLEKIALIPATPRALEVADSGNLAAVMWGVDGDRLNFIEVHNISRGKVRTSPKTNS